MASSFLQVISQIKNGINYFRVPLNKLNLRNMKQKKKKKYKTFSGKVHSYRQLVIVQIQGYVSYYFIAQSYVQYIFQSSLLRKK